MQIQATKREFINPFWLYCRAHFCPDCGTRLNPIRVSRVIHTDSPEGRTYFLPELDGYIRVIGTELKCAACRKNYAVAKIRRAEREQRRAQKMRNSRRADLEASYRLFFEHMGDEAAMERDEPEDFGVYLRAKPSPRERERWWYRIAEYYLYELKAGNCSELVSSAQHPAPLCVKNAVMAIGMLQKGAEEFCAELIEALDGLRALPFHAKIGVMEIMAGRSETQEDGGICLICTKTPLADRLIAVMDRFADFTCPEDAMIGAWAEVPASVCYDAAKKRIEQSYRLFYGRYMKAED